MLNARFGIFWVKGNGDARSLARLHCVHSTDRFRYELGAQVIWIAQSDYRHKVFAGKLTKRRDTWRAERGVELVRERLTLTNRTTYMKRGGGTSRVPACACRDNIRHCPLIQIGIRPECCSRFSTQLLGSSNTEHRQQGRCENRR
jgi:hypothetical protein